MANESQGGARKLAPAEIEAALENPLEGEMQWLETLLAVLGNSDTGFVLFDRLHAAAVRDQRLAELATAYEQMAHTDSLSELGSELRSEFFVHAARFSQQERQDRQAMTSYAESALAATEGTEALLVHLDSVFLDIGEAAQLAALYDAAASRRADNVDRQVRLLDHAVRMLDLSPESCGYLLPLKDRLVRLRPTEHIGWLEELQQNYESAGKQRAIVELLEAALAASPPLSSIEARPLRLRLAALYQAEGTDRSRAVPHLEALALHGPLDGDFVRVAEPLLEQKALAPRIVPLLSDAYEVLGRIGDEIQSLTMELKISRPPRLARVYRRLAVLRQDVLDDASGALELLESLITREPADDEIRNRYVAVSEALGRSRDALRCLSRLLRSAPDDASRSRIAFDVARLYMRAGDEQRAQSAFEQVLEIGGDVACRLAAARQLIEQRASLAPEVVARALAAVAAADPDPMVRQASASELLELGRTIPLDNSALISAWRALLHSARELEALEQLEILCQATGDKVGLSDVLERRAALEPDADRARDLAFRGAELRAGLESTPEGSVDVWRRHIAQYGRSRAAHAKYIPLLESSRAYDELVSALTEEAKLASGLSRADVLARLSEVRLRQMGDPSGALESIQASLLLDPGQAKSRELLEAMLDAGEVAAADLLEPLCEKESSTSTQAAHVLIRILELRLARSRDPSERLVLWQRLGQLIDAAPLPSEVRLAVCARAMRPLSQERVEALSEWLERVERLASDHPLDVAELLTAILNEEGLDAHMSSKFSTVAARALERAGRLEQALEQYERAFEFGDASAELLEQASALASHLGRDPAQRVERYEALLERTNDPDRRADLLYVKGNLEQGELHDLQAAVASWQRAFEANPKHWPSHVALVSAHQQEGDTASLERELRRGLMHFDGQQRRIVLSRLADALASWNRQFEALALLVPLLDGPTLDDDMLETLERIAREAESAETLSRVLQRRLDAAQSLSDRARALERMGEFLEEWHANPAGAAKCWKDAAAELCGPGGAPTEAIRLYERALGATPEDVETAKRLVELYSEAGDWSRVPELFAVFQRCSKDVVACGELLLSLEGSASQASAANEFSELVASLLWGATQSESPWARPLLCAKARVLAAASHYDEAADVCRTLLESYGESSEGHVVQQFEALIDSSPDSDWRRQNLRWLFEWRADHCADPSSLLLRWASIEERDFGDPQAAIVLLERAAAREAGRIEALEGLIRLRMEGAEVEGTLDALRRLQEVAPEEHGRTVALHVVSLLRGMERDEEALSLIAGLLDRAPRDAELRMVVSGFLREPSPIRERAAELLERASAVGDSVEQHKEVLERLLESTAEQDEWEDSATPRLRALRRGWFERLLEFASGQPAIVVAERAAFEFPQDEVVWHVLERLTAEADAPMTAVRCYERALARPLGAGTAERLGRLLLAFAEEHAIDARGLTGALERVLALSPGARWALDRVKLALTLEQRWTALFSLYDRAVQAIEDDVERADLLDEAAIVARDVVGDMDRAIGYWEQLFELRPGDVRIDMVLERLYDRRGQTEKLISHLLRRVGILGGPEQRLLRRRIAVLWLDLGRGQPALDLIEGLLSEASDDASVYDLLERIVGFSVSGEESSPEASADRRTIRLAAQRLRQRYSVQGRHDDVGRLLEVELSVCETSSERAFAWSELLEHRLGLGDRAGAFECVGELLLLEPELPTHRTQLTALARELGAYERLASLLFTAAGSVSDPDTAAILLEQAAHVHVEPLGQTERAAQLLRRILESPVEPDTQRRAGRTLEGLLSSLGRPKERCEVLERLTDLETDGAVRQATLVEAGRVAFDQLSDPLRAARSLQRALKEAPTEYSILDGLVRALRAGESWNELCDALAARVRIRRHGPEARQDLAEIGRIFSDRLSDPDRAIEIWRLVRKRYGSDDENREALAELLERQERWSELAALLSEAAQTSPSPGPLLSRLARVHREHTGDAAGAILAHIGASEWSDATALWEANVDALGEDSPLAAKLGTALKEAGRFEEAERVLRRLLERFGRRSTKERGQLHCELAELLRVAGRSEVAMTELLSALAMTPADPRILAAIGRLACERGDLERAEQSYRMLLLVLRRPEDAAEARLSRAEVYVELSDIAERRSDADAASDYMASAFEVAVDTAAEAAGLERALRQSRKPELLERALQRRLEHAIDPREGARALESLIEVAAGRVSGDRVFANRVLEHADRVWQGLEPRLADPAHIEASKRLIGVYRRLGEGRRVAAVLSSTAIRSDSEVERFALELEAARELLDIPAARDEATSRLRRLVDRNPADEDAFSMLCQALEDDGQIEDVLELVRARIESSATDTEDESTGLLRLHLAGLLERAGRVKEAIEIYEVLAEGSRFRVEALRAIAHLEQEGGTDPARLAAVLERLILLEEGPARAAISLRILALRSDEDSSAAERVLSLGFFAEPTHTDLRERLLRLYWEESQWRKAASVLERAIEAVPSDSSLRLRLSDALARDGDTEGALSALKFASHGQEEAIELGRRRFQVLRDAGRFEEAVEALESVAQLDGRYCPDLVEEIENAGLNEQSERWALRYADLVAAQGHRDVGMSALRRWLSGHPDSVPALRSLAVLASELGELPVAIDAWKRLLEREDPAQRPAIALELARVCDSSDRAGEAAEALERALADAPDLIGLRRRLRTLYAKMGAHRKEAQLLLEEADRETELLPRVERLIEASELLCKMGAPSEALDAVARIRRDAPDRTEGVVLYARVLVAQEKRVEALAEIRRFLDTHTPRPSKVLGRLYRQMAEIHLADDDLIEALEALGQAHRMNKGDSEVALLLGLVAVDLDELDVANSALRTFVAIKGEAVDAVRSDGPSPVSRAYYLLAWIEHVKGHNAAAKRMASRAVEEGPHNREARQLLEKLSAP